MIFVECDPDYVLAKSLTRGKDISHAPNKPEVCKELEKSTRCTGMIDEDPDTTQYQYITKLEQSGVKENFKENDLRLLYDSSRQNRLIILCPRLEDWVLRSAQLIQIEINTYFLPEKPSQLRNVLTLGHKNKKHMDNFKNLLADLEKTSPRVKTLKDLLEKSS